jgi:hypothetical protein
MQDLGQTTATSRPHTDLNIAWGAAKLANEKRVHGLHIIDTVLELALTVRVVASNQHLKRELSGFI